MHTERMGICTNVDQGPQCRTVGIGVRFPEIGIAGLGGMEFGMGSRGFGDGVFGDGKG